MEEAQEPTQDKRCVRTEFTDLWTPKLS